MISISLSAFGLNMHDNRIGSDVNKQADNAKAFERNKNIGRGINFGNALESPNEGDWGMVIKESYIQAIADAGFNSVRLPISWSTHITNTYPYTIDPTFLHRIDEIMNWCLQRNLAVIITIHHFDNLYNYPDNAVYKNMFFAIWNQLTDHYLSIDHERLFFEVLNEPEVNLTADKWNLLMPQIVDSIRSKDTDRTLIIDGPNYAYHASLVDLNIPESIQNVIVSTRYYLPYQFAQQGSWWNTWTDMNQFLGTTWTGTDSEKKSVLTDLAFIKNWSTTHNRPITIGEYGSIMYADNQSRLTWTNYVRTQFENNGFSWSYFDFGVVFKVYSLIENKWLNGFVEALTGNSTAISDGWVSDSININPQKPSNADPILVTSILKIPAVCSLCDSVKIRQIGSTIKITSYHSGNIPQSNSLNSCSESVRLDKYPIGNYQLIFDNEYLDKVNTIHYSIKDTIAFQVVNPTVTTVETKTIKIYPVPASRFLIVNNMAVNSQYQIYSMNGQLQHAGRIVDGKINISDLKTGEYILKINGKETILFNKIVES